MGLGVIATPKPLYHREVTRYPMYRRLVGSHGRSEQVRKNLAVMCKLKGFRIQRGKGSCSLCLAEKMLNTYYLNRLYRNYKL